MRVTTKKRYLKKIPYYLLLTLLTTGASLILGFLSFGGMYALIPVLPLAFATFGLSVAYEGEIYLQNIKGSFKKLFKSHYLEHLLAKEYLAQNFPTETDDPDCPQFFKDYEQQLKLLDTFNQGALNAALKKHKRQIEKNLADMEQWFALQLFAAQALQHDETIPPYTLKLRLWLANHEQSQWQTRLKERQTTFKYVKGFSSLAALFMGLGSTYLIVEAFSVIPFFAVIPFALWPFIVVPMSIIAGAAYGMLTYNTITNLIHNDTLRAWYYKLRHDLSQGITVRTVFMTTVAVILAALAIALTICTAGTWWTVATTAQPLFEWMKKMPSFIMGVINPIITGLSAIFFNLQNSAESLELVDEATRSDKSLFRSTFESIAQRVAQARDTENGIQFFNPFRIILKLTLTPLRILLFLGHLISIALTSDRMPGVPQIVSALVGMICEGFEDAHYFASHEEHPVQNAKTTAALLEERMAKEANNEPDTDIPTRLLKFLALPLYALAAGWDCLASHYNTWGANHKKVLTLSQAWAKQRGIEPETDTKVPVESNPQSPQWKVTHTLFLLDKYRKQQLNHVMVGAELAGQKSIALNELINEIRATEPDEEHLEQLLSAAQKNPIYNQHRLFAVSQDEKTTTQEFIETLPNRVNLIC